MYCDYCTEETNHATKDCPGLGKFSVLDKNYAEDVKKLKSDWDVVAGDFPVG